MSEAATNSPAPPAVQTSGPPAPDNYAFKPHALLPLPSAEEMAADMADPIRKEALVKYLNGRGQMLRAAEVDPLNHSLRLSDSKEVDELLTQYQLVYESGGKRAGKTEDGVPRFLRCCFKYGKAKRWAMQDNALSSIANLQQKFWDYLPAWVKALNNKRTHKYRVHYSPQNGFDGLLILPTGCEIYFLNYTQNPSDFLGWELGKGLDIPLDPATPDIGALLDENCPLAWLENIQLRCSTRGAKIHWMYSPQDGITAAIKDLKSNARTTKSRLAELLADRVNVPGLPKGHMPLVQVDQKKRLAIFYRYTQNNPFSGYHNPGGVKELCEGKNDRAYTMAHAYGYCEAVRGRAFPIFGEWNVVKESELPADGTNYMVTDPGGARNWFTLWCRVTPGRPSEIYIYREWPDYDSYGDWAVTSKSKVKLNGERGPAQPTIGYGPPQYKNLFLQKEKLLVPKALGETLQVKAIEDLTDEDWDRILKGVSDPHWRRRIRRAGYAQTAGNAWQTGKIVTEEPEGFEDLQEEIFERLIDPRAARNQSAADGKGIDLISKLAMQNRNEKTGVIEAGPMHFTPAPGLDIRDGISQINELLFFNQHEDRVPLVNMPRLFVNEKCRNLIWAMNNYSLPDDAERANDDACEDPVDDLRYLITRGVRYILPGGKVITSGGGSY